MRGQRVDRPRRWRIAPRIGGLILVFVAACGGGDLLEKGRFEGTTYVHDGFGLRIPVPAEWVIAEETTTRQLDRAGRQLLSAGDPTGGAYAAGGAATSRTLLAAYRYPLGSVPGINPSLVVAAENIAARPQIQTATDYLQMLQSFLGRGGTPLAFEPIVNDAQLGGQSFAVLGATLQPTQDLRIGQVYHARRVDDYMLTVVATFSTEQQWAEMERILQSIEMQR